MEQWIKREVEKTSGNVVGHDDADLMQEGRLIVWQRGPRTPAEVRRCVRSQLNRLRLAWMTEKRMPHDKQGRLLPVLPYIGRLQTAVDGSTSHDSFTRNTRAQMPDRLVHDPNPERCSVAETQLDVARFAARYPVEFDVIQKHFAETGTLEHPECEDAVRCAREFFS